MAAFFKLVVGGLLLQVFLLESYPAVQSNSVTMLHKLESYD
jgi:hypothetical protein